MSIKKKSSKLVGKVVNTVTSSVSQTSVKNSDKRYSVSDEIKQNCRIACAEGCVLLKNDGDILPFSSEDKLSVFGRVQYDTFFVGYGSGGDVNAFYKVSINEGIKRSKTININTELDGIYKQWIKKHPADDGYWGHWPMSYDEMPVSDALAERSAKISDTALVVIGRAAGEDRDNTLTKGSYYLTENEEKMLSAVSRNFKKFAVVLNIGGVFDFSWVEKYNVPAVLICWQGGMETGNGLADVLSGKISPSGKLTDTISVAYDAYPTAHNFGNKKKNLYEEDIFVGYRYFETFDKQSVLFPFGHGLTYSSFVLSDISSDIGIDRIFIKGKIKNTGKYASKNVIELYFSAKNTPLDMPDVVLYDYFKTDELQGNEEQSFAFEIPFARLATFDENGRTGFCSSLVFQNGTYDFLIGFSCEDLQLVSSHFQKSSVLIEKLDERCAPDKSERLMHLKKIDNNGNIAISYEPAECKTINTRSLIKSKIPEFIYNSKPDCTFCDVKEGNVTLEEFVASLSLKELEALSRGDYTMNSPLGAKGNAGVFGGVSESLRKKGVSPIVCTDGPSGIRLAARASLLPCGTALACTWNNKLVYDLYGCIADEMIERDVDVLLGPGMNIHRDPLCGRNFEYFSEDPLVTGRIASAVVSGLQSRGVSACPKHFACNNQETNRIHNNSVVSQRALRDIYLKGFEICVKEAKPKNIMTSYNKINGVWSHYNYELVTGILRNEWKYEGNVITDWWMRSSNSPEFPHIRNQAYRVRAGVDVLMPGGKRTGKRKPDGTLVETLGTIDGITLGELQQTALHVLCFALYKEKESN